MVEQDERELIAYKRGATRLGFAWMLKFFEIEARRVTPVSIRRRRYYVARQVGVDPDELVEYEWTGRTLEYHRSQIRRALGFRRFGEDDEAKLAGWLADEVAPVELSDDGLCEALPARCRAERLEPPARVERIIGAARAAVTDHFTASTVSRLSPGDVGWAGGVGRDRRGRAGPGQRGVAGGVEGRPSHRPLPSVILEMLISGIKIVPICGRRHVQEYRPSEGVLRWRLPRRKASVR